jgi:hypothetical protein
LLSSQLKSSRAPVLIVLEPRTPSKSAMTLSHLVISSWICPLPAIRLPLHIQIIFLDLVYLFLTIKIKKYSY